jgi:lysophospholipid acyltransferase (LPLAT)-like uncharacterized protein
MRIFKGSQWLTKTGGLLASVMMRGWMRTLDSQVAFYEPLVDPAHTDHSDPCIYLFWHEYILLPVSIYGHCNVAMLLSQHQDAEFLREAGRFLGFSAVRGSTRRGAVPALRKMLRDLGNMNLGVTPDGPVGPRRKLAQGCIYLSAKLRMPLVCVGYGCDRPWRIRKAWDQFAIPRPFSRACAIFGPRIQIPAEIDRSSLTFYRQQVESLLNGLTCEAERWAKDGGRYRRQESFRPRAETLRRAA